MEEENKCGRRGRSGEGWKPKSERRLEEKKGRKATRERRKTGEEKVRGKTWEEKEKLSQSPKFGMKSTQNLMLNPCSIIHTSS